MTRVLVVGLDCAPPSLVFERFGASMPFVSSLQARGTWGPLRSVMPPITVPAWACMTSGRDAGELGVYGFRDRRPGQYGLSLVTSKDVHAERIWDVAGAHGKRSCVLFVPPSHPPTPVQNGQLVSCFLTPSARHPHTFPAQLGAELEARFGPYRMDADGARSGDFRAFLGGLFAMTKQHFDIAEHLWTTESPDLLFMVEIGPDRLHHALWAHLDPAHPRYVSNSPFAAECERYYALLDARIAQLAAASGDDTAILIASDHGARALLGGVCVNEWLIANGWLALRETPASARALTPDMVDWKRTRAWGEGGYFARVFLNVAGREPEGVIPPGELESVRTELEAALSGMRGPTGTLLGNRVVRPEVAYSEVRGNPPELMCLFGDLDYRSIGTVGGGRVFVEGDERGPDGCNHDWNGVLVLGGAGVSARGRIEDAQLHDVGRTALGLLGLPIPEGWKGRDLSA